MRRTLGLLTFGYASLHAFIYFVFDQQLSPSGIAADVLKHPWVTVGFTADVPGAPVDGVGISTFGVFTVAPFGGVKVNDVAAGAE